ncbi:MAG: hypothetical protein IPJ88_07050 [Myxococcales bacterium]|nr:MAG: hypothetical protein IPJ88_07050 [Myxococcales bacterium]
MIKTTISILTFLLMATLLSACGRIGFDAVDTQSLQVDSDNDSVLDSAELAEDTDGDGILNFLDNDDDGDRILTAIEIIQEQDNADGDEDGRPAYLDTDSDGDGLLDIDEGQSDLDADGIPNYLDVDSDGDQISDSIDADTYCSDGIRNFNESDVDCGGLACLPCSEGSYCLFPFDCSSGICTGNTCTTSNCSDGLINQDETDIDCGGSTCPACTDGATCDSGSDCSSGTCTGNICTTSNCSDGLMNQDETDVDCGGSSCSACSDGLSCTVAGDCTSGVCTGNICQAATCSDSTWNQDETDVDCGGSTCSTCADGLSCTAGGDCGSGVCTGNVCQVPTCTDTVQNFDETDVDCGGSTCSACADGLSCAAGSDCISSVCTGNICQAATCSDSVNNQDETDVDCGGSSCSVCTAGQGCSAGSDCDSGVCSGSICQAPTCSDSVQNFDETDIDCGGTICGACTTGQSCGVGGDCDSSVCTGNVCQAATCSDGFWNQDETTTDCGGSICSPCPPGGGCSAGSDCDSGVCTGNVCQAPTCSDSVQNQDETGVDCGGSICGSCSSGTVVEVSAGASHVCAITNSSAVRCWGYNGSAQLGYGHTNNIGDDEPASAAGDVSVGGNVIQVSAGGVHTCALLDTGTVRCWGANSFGQLGYGNTTIIGDDELPSSAGDVNVGGTVTQIATGYQHTCALLSTGTVRCWGLNAWGQLGYGNTTTIGDDELPSSAGDVNVGGTVTQISCGRYHTCALLDTGAVRCWGGNNHGQLGYGNTNTIGDNETPASAGDVSVGGTVTQVKASETLSCALLDIGTVRCWGWGFTGQLGYGNTNSIGDNETPASAGDVSVGGTVSSIDVGSGHVCALLDTGTVRCWGTSADAQLGYGNKLAIGDNELPSSAGDVTIGGTATQVVAGYIFSCALLDTGALRCWGYGGYGTLGYGNINMVGDNETPASVGDVPLF